MRQRHPSLVWLPLADDAAGSVPVEYAILAATAVLAIFGALLIIGGDTSLGMAPLLNAFANALS